MSPLNPSRTDIEADFDVPGLEPFEAAIEAGDFALAARLCEEAQATPRFGEDEAYRGAVLLALCRVLRTTGDYPLALASGEEAFRIFKLLGSMVNVARCHNRIGAVHYRLGNAEDAEKHYRAALHLYEWDCPDQWGRAHAHNNLGVLFVQRAQWTLALEHLGRAISIAETRLGDFS